MDLDLVLRTSGLLVAALVSTRMMTRATAATRHLLWHVAVIAVLLAPAVILVAPRFTVSIPAQLTPSIASPLAVGTPMELVNITRCDWSHRDCAPSLTFLGSIGLDAIAWLAGAGTWIVGAWFLFGWLVSGWQAARTTDAPFEWLNDTRRIAARLGLSQAPRVRQTPQAGSPRVAGLFQSIVLVPNSAHAWSPAEREAALVHELSHIRRGDRRTQALAQLVCAFYWFNPLAWIAARELSRERERACDDEVLKAGIRPSAYAALLLDLAKGEHAWAPAAALGMARPSTIEGRLLAILATDADATVRGSRRIRTFGATRWIVVTGSVVVVAAVLGAQQPRATTRDSARARTDKVMGGPILMQIEERQDTSPLTEALVRALDDPDRQVREHAALGLALVPGRETIDPLLTALADSDAQVREKAAIGLAFRRDARVMEPLLKAMGDSDAQVREKVAIALGASGDPRALSALERALDDPDAQVREKAASGLLLLGPRK